MAVLLAGMALADAPATSLRPLPRPAETQPAAEKTAPEIIPPEETAAVADSPAPRISLRPQPRRQAASALAQAAPTGPPVGYRGALCGDAAIKGQVLAPITSRVKGCGVAEPVSVEFVAGVRINPPAILDCTTAEALKTWVKKALPKAFAPRKVVELHIFGSYMCRPRNNVRGAKISEHGQGKAVDIGGFVLDNGQALTVEDNYNRQIRKAQSLGCGIFGTTLGPGSDGYHENHLHFDTAGYRSGPYCH